MSVREIPANQWRDFLTEFSAAHKAWLATVDNAGPATSEGAVPIEQPLQSVSPAIENDRVVGIEIRFQPKPEGRDAIRIDGPEHVRVEETSEGTARGLEIVSRDGGRTQLRFRSAPRTEMLDGLAPGELSPK